MAELKNLIVEGDSRLIGDTNAGKITASSIVKSGGTSSQFLKADGSVDSTAYTTNTGTVTSVGAGTGLSISGTASVNPTVNVASGYKLPTTTEWTNATPFEKGAGANSVQQKGTSAVASGASAVAEGDHTTASGQSSHAEGCLTRAVGRGSHAEGIEYNDIGTAAEADAAHAEGAGVVVKGQAAHGEGVLNVAGRTQEEAVAALADFPNLGGTTEQKVSKLIGFGSHVEGTINKALGSSSHAEGYSTQALVNSTHAEGDTTTASGEAAHSEGYKTTASGNQAHAEGYYTEATANQSHAEGQYTKATSGNAHAEGKNTTANGEASHTEGFYTVANNNVEHAEGQYNVSIANVTRHTVGIGNSSTRKNAHTITADGKHYIPGIGTYVGTETTLPTGQDLATIVNSKTSLAIGTTATTAAAGNHTHTTTIAAGTSGDTSQITLANGGKYKLTAGGTDYVFTMPSGSSSDIYWATYGTTPYADIKTAMLTNNKIVLMRVQSPDDSETFVLRATYYNDVDQEIFFMGYLYEGQSESASYSICVDENNSWSDYSSYLQSASYRASSITSSNKTSTSYYASTKAVYNYVERNAAGRYSCTKTGGSGVTSLFCCNGNLVCYGSSSSFTGTFIMTVSNFYAAFMKSIGGYTLDKEALSDSNKVTELAYLMTNSSITKLAAGSGSNTRHQFSYQAINGSTGTPVSFTYGASASGCRIAVSTSGVTLTIV